MEKEHNYWEWNHRKSFCLEKSCAPSHHQKMPSCWLVASYHNRIGERGQHICLALSGHLSTRLNLPTKFSLLFIPFLLELCSAFCWISHQLEGITRWPVRSDAGLKNLILMDPCLRREIINLHGSSYRLGREMPFREHLRTSLNFGCRVIGPTFDARLHIEAVLYRTITDVLAFLYRCRRISNKHPYHVSI